MKHLIKAVVCRSPSPSLPRSAPLSRKNSVLPGNIRVKLSVDGYIISQKCIWISVQCGEFKFGTGHRVKFVPEFNTPHCISLMKGEIMFCSVDSEADNLAAMSQQELLGVAKR